MAKTDLKNDFKELYHPTQKEITIVDVPTFNCIMVDGKGDPNNSKEFQTAIEALYPIAYGIKFGLKKSGGPEFAVMPLEGLWWSDDMNDFLLGRKDKWSWTIFIVQPEFVTKEMFEEAREVAKKRKDNPVIDKVRFEAFTEGKSAQILYVGPFADEGPTIQEIHKKITEVGGKLSGKHHEIYLSDMRRVTPDKYKTVIRQPFEL